MRICSSRALVAAAAVALSLAPLGASSPKFFSIDTQADFLKGDVENLSIDSQGRLMLGPATELVYETSAPFLWSLLPRPDGTDPEGFHVEVVYAITPSTQNTTYDFWMVARDFALDDDGVSQFLRDSNRTVVLQDVTALDLLEQVIASEPEGTQELSINIDTGGLAARRLIARLAGEAAGATQAVAR